MVLIGILVVLMVLTIQIGAAMHRKKGMIWSWTVPYGFALVEIGIILFDLLTMKPPSP